MTTKYLELDSTYRNRQLWPNPAHFEALVAPSTTITAESAVDPVSNSAPIASWTSNEFRATVPASSSVTGTFTGVGGSPSTIVITGPNLQQASNYYLNSTISYPSNDVSVTGPLYSKVTAYTYLGNNTAQLTIAPPAQLIPGNVVTVSDPTDLALNRVFVPNGSSTPNAYVGYYLYDVTTNKYLPITFYDPATGLVYAPGSMAGWSPTDVFQISKSPPAFASVAGVASTSSSVVLGPAANGIANVVGSFVRISATGETRRIISYDPATTTAVVFPSFSATTSGAAYQFLPFSYDGCVPFVYTGTAQFEMANYFVTLKSLTLPNATLTAGVGGTVSSYPYVYVELAPINSSARNVISSNNPHSTKALFRASYVNFDKTVANDFVHFVGDGMTQRVRFLVETDFRFKVTLNNGDIFSTVETETVSPVAPNPKAQISALFEIRKEPYMELAKRLV